MLKADIRKLYQLKRLKLKDNDLQKFSDQISGRFLQFLPSYVREVHVYLPIEKKREVNTWPIIRQLWQRGLRTVVPSMEEGSNQLRQSILTPDSVLKNNRYDVPQPETAQVPDGLAVDLVIVPMLACDKRGFRVGYGKGYYDRFLGSLGEKPLKVGLSCFEPIDLIADIDHFDIPLHHCVLPDRVVDFV
jgi:5-formyltetrahydrofolate cyclo-ligase